MMILAFLESDVTATELVLLWIAALLSVLTVFGGPLLACSVWAGSIKRRPVATEKERNALAFGWVFAWIWPMVVGLALSAIFKR